MPKKNLALQILIGKRIASLRIENHLKQDELAEKVGLSTNFLARVEQGEKGLSADSAIRIAKAFQVSTDYLLLGEVRREEAEHFEQALSTLSEEQRASSIKILDVMMEMFSQNEPKSGSKRVTKKSTAKNK